MTLQTADIVYLFGSVAFAAGQKLAEREELPEGTPFPIFAHGSYEEVKRCVEVKDAAIGNRNSFPMLWLITPVEQSLATGDGVCDLTDVQLLLLMPTKPDLSDDQQIQQVLKPVLRPIYLELLRQIEVSGFFSVLSPESVPHRAKEWTYRSVGEGGNNLFDKALCAIQIKGLRLTVNESVPVNYQQITNA